MTSRTLGFGLLLPLLAGCASSHHADHPGPSFNAASIVGAADWSRAAAQTIALSDYAFTPDNPVFTHDQPYRLHLENKATHTHTFGSHTFFQAIAIQSVQVNGSDIPTQGLTNIELPAGQVADISFVAVKPGTYDLYCDIFLHETMGMDGKIVIN